MPPQQDPNKAQYESSVGNSYEVIPNLSTDISIDIDSDWTIDTAKDWAEGGFSAVDINVYIHLPSEMKMAPDKLGTLAMLSVSSHRDKFPVSALSRISSRGFTAGHRMIAGTLVFNTIERDAFLKYSIRRRTVVSTGATSRYLLQPDDLPPFDIQIIAINDAGNMSCSMLKGVTLLDSGATYSLDQVVLSETYSYMALERTPFEPLSMRLNGKDSDIDYSKSWTQVGGSLPGPGEVKLMGWTG